MAEQLFDAPLAGGVTEIAVGFAAAGEEQHGLAALLVEGGEDVVVFDQGDVALVIGIVLVALRATGKYAVSRLPDPTRDAKPIALLPAA